MQDRDAVPENVSSWENFVAYAPLSMSDLGLIRDAMWDSAWQCLENASWEAYETLERGNYFVAKYKSKNNQAKSDTALLWE